MTRREIRRAFTAALLIGTAGLALAFEPQLMLENPSTRRLGPQVALEGNLAVVATRDNAQIPGSPLNGEVYVYRQDPSGQWPRVATLTSPDPSDDDDFGASIAIDGGTIVVGDNRYPHVGPSSGAVYVFEPDDNWGNATRLTPSDAAAWDYFGFSVAKDGDTLVVGAPLEAPVGAAYVFNREITQGRSSWVEVAKLTSPLAERVIGHVVAIGADTVAVSEWVFTEAFVFQRNHGGPEQWGLVKVLETGVMGTIFEFNGLALDGTTLVFGPLYDQVSPGISSGAAWFFERDQGGPDNWGLVTKLYASDASDFDHFGSCLAFRGDVLFVGAFLADHGTWDERGAVYLFQPSTIPPLWREITWFLPPDVINFGLGCQLSGDTLLVGAEKAAFIYTLNIFADGFSSGDTSAWSSGDRR